VVQAVPHTAEQRVIEGPWHEPGGQLARAKGDHSRWLVRPKGRMLSCSELASAIIRGHLIRVVTASGELLPLAVAIAISITTMITTVLMLLSPKAKSRTVALLVGCVVGVGGAVALFASLGALLPQDFGGSSLVPGVINMVVGVLLVVLALRQWRARHTKGDRAELPRWMAEVDSMMPSKALALGLLLSAVVPKNLLLALSAGVIVGEARLSVGEASVVIVVFTAIATSTVAVPVVAHLVAPARMRDPLERLRQWLVENNVTIMVLVLLLIGVVMIGNSIASF
jgi:Sap, sulfolipid-1-addressing protein